VIHHISKPHSGNTDVKKRREKLCESKDTNTQIGLYQRLRVGKLLQFAVKKVSLQCTTLPMEDLK